MDIQKLEIANDLQRQIKELKEKIKGLQPSKNTNENCTLTFKSVNVGIVFSYPRANNSDGEDLKNIWIERDMVKHLYYQYKNELMAKLHKLETRFSQL